MKPCPNLGTMTRRTRRRGRLVLATRNAGKLRELARILPPSRARPPQVARARRVPRRARRAETGATFEENALLKARAIAAYTGLPAVADDSGLCVDALHGMPGVLSARWAGKHGDDQANLDLVLASWPTCPTPASAPGSSAPPRWWSRRGRRDAREWVVTRQVEGRLTRCRAAPASATTRSSCRTASSRPRPR
jgi:hypothetical protein